MRKDNQISLDIEPPLPSPLLLLPTSEGLCLHTMVFGFFQRKGRSQLSNKR